MKTEAILDAAAGLFAGRGVNAVGMGEIARAAGCSRATLYRYFPDRHELHVAFVQREARRIGGLLPTDDPVEAILAALREVRARPELLAWFGAADAGTTAELAQSEAVVGMLGDGETARWLVRVIVSLLIVPGRDETEERALVERFVVPGVLGARR
ncbi:TetR family transcriptional regulator [Nocardioides sp. MAH-18]|uniref:TetR family transcriptional regulator n=1 Tax=Nocardioides agri TaxID=2682843 RepID=A0A6L6XSQ8_9ACTN|nr:TetR family transcriptional regulator [Nocardioides sp. CGMCC 1.13656]MBA2954988.1 TetR family transcriptional regulator [Nocardioides sp. CGMCC 1.13656]MVQ49842.1 TetR family transcriptional regulator [Nocardioides sp. MAH-18]